MKVNGINLMVTPKWIYFPENRDLINLDNVTCVLADKVDDTFAVVICLVAGHANSPYTITFENEDDRDKFYDALVGLILNRS